MLRRWLVPALGVICLLGLTPFTFAQERILGVVPQGAPSALATQWQPLINYLQETTGIPIRFATASTINRFEQRVLKGEFDYVYMNPLLYVRAHKAIGYHALVRRKNPLRGILVTPRDSKMSLAGLDGATITFPSPTAFAATLLIRAELNQKKINYHVSYAGTHESAYQGVIVGRYPAAGGIRRTFDLLPERSREKLRILLETKPVTGHVIAAHPRITRAESAQITKALENLRNSDSGTRILEGLKVKHFVASKRTDFKSINSMAFPPVRSINRIDFLVIPRLSEADTIRQMNPMISYIRQQLELELELRTYPTMGKFDRAISKEAGPALINANPLQAIKLSKKGYRVIAQQTPVSAPDGMRSVILVAKNSPYKSLADLKHKRIAFGGNRNAFFASVVPRVMLSRAGLHGQYIDASRPGTVADVVRRLRNGEIDAAGTGSMAINSKLLMDKYGIDQMPIIARSEPMPGLAWLVSKDVPPDIENELRDILLHFGPSAPGHTAMTTAGIAGLQPATIKTYAPVKRYIAEESRLR